MSRSAPPLPATFCAPLLVLVLGACAHVAAAPVPPTPPAAAMPSDLGAFSVSLAVRDLAASRAFYERLGFTAVAGAAPKWLILRNGTVTIGLFEGMLERNSLTFNPGWNARAEPVAEFEDVRSIQERLERAGLEITLRTDPDGQGPAHIVLTDPDGNPVLIDQHVPRPR